MLPQNKRNTILIFLSINAVYFFSYFQRIAVPGTIFNELQTSFLLSASAVATLGTLYLYIYGGMQFFAGILADRIGAGRVLIAGGTLLSAGSILFPLSHSLTALYLSRALVGFGASLIFISIIKELDNLFDNRDFPFFLAASLVLGYSGGLFGTLPFERAVHFFGWRNSLFAAGILCSLSVIFMSLLFQKTGQLAKKGKNFSFRVIQNIVRNRRSFPVIFCGSINFSIYFLIQAAFGKKFLQDCYQLDSKTAAGFTFVMMLTLICCLLSVGYISRAIGRRKPIMVCATSITLFSILLMTLALIHHFTVGWFLLGYILLAVSSSASPLYTTSMKELSPAESAATAVGFLNGICYLSVSLFINLAGFGLDRFRASAIHTSQSVIYPPQAYLTVFTGCLFFAAASCFTSFFIGESYGKYIYGTDAV
ncbi:MAG: MFS transporter [Candidatus Omnitrophica bacterium]|nr:MFS transporter [Candidatus Omnitrophota bacterium]